MFKLEVENGKYTFINDNGIVKVLRYREEWREEAGDKALLSLLQEVEKMQEKLAIYSSALNDIEYAMGKVGWNNTRIEDAFEEMNEKLKQL